MVWAWLIAAVVFLLGSAFYSGTEMGLYCVNRLRLRLHAEHESRSAALLSLVDRPQETVLGILLGVNLANYLLTVAATHVVMQASGLQADVIDVYTAAILSPIIFVFGDVVPKNWYQVQPDSLMQRSTRLLQASVGLFRWTGILYFLRAMTRFSSRIAGGESSEQWLGPRGEVVGMMREGAAGGAMSPVQAEIVERVMNLSDVRVGAIMLPQRLVRTLSVTDTRDHVEQIARWYPYSRLPVLAENGRTVLGVLNVLDLLADPRGNIQKWMQPPMTILASESAAGALVRMQRSRTPLAVVTDPRRGFVGILTLKDVVEEILGELSAW